MTEEERAVGQRLTVDLEVELAVPPAGESLERAVDYRRLLSTVVALSRKPHVLLENLAVSIADGILKDPRIREILVRVNKPGPPVESPLEAFGVEVRRGR